MQHERCLLFFYLILGVVWAFLAYGPQSQVDMWITLSKHDSNDTSLASKSTFDNLTSQLEASGNNSPVGEVEAF